MNVNVKYSARFAHDRDYWRVRPIADEWTFGLTEVGQYFYTPE